MWIRDEPCSEAKYALQGTLAEASSSPHPHEAASKACLMDSGMSGRTTWCVPLLSWHSIPSLALRNCIEVSAPFRHNPGFQDTICCPVMIMTLQRFAWLPQTSERRL